MWQEAVDFFFPKKCVGCGKLELDFCDNCKRELAISEQICPMCGKGSLMGWTHKHCQKKLGMDGLTVLYQYQDELTRKVIDGIKYDFNKNLVGETLKSFVFEMGLSFDLVTSIPLYFYRRNWRGFNQAELIARDISKKNNLEYVDCVVRTKNTKQQALMKTKKERESNIKGAFCMKSNDHVDLRGKRILLVDDVFTSGTNMRECTKVLKNKGALFVWGFVLAH